VRDGAVRLPNAALGCVADLAEALREYPSDEAGVRIHGNAKLKRLLDREGSIGAIAATALGERSRPVRAILFNKTSNTNWSLGWHQDRTISVKERRDVSGFGPWTRKGGMNHVEPPFGLLARMITLRVHLDDVGADNAPLLVAPGSHKLGRVLEDKMDEVVSRCGTKVCLAGAGDVWLYSAPILHASKAATVPTTRRVLQIDYAVEELPEGLTWLGI
jgi:ectoine hydroxylase-related dioxygenase (phytanoyl-CoA dioxygenase family)